MDNKAALGRTTRFVDRTRAPDPQRLVHDEITTLSRLRSSHR